MNNKKVISLVKKQNRFSNKAHDGIINKSNVVKNSSILFDEHYYTYPIQMDIIGSLVSNISKGTMFPIQLQSACEKIMKHINTKVSSYQMQDKIKKRTIPENFIKNKDIIHMLKKCELTCHYCRQHVFLIYKNEQEMEQWTLDRIDNSIAHTKENVVISCLKCNLNKGRKNEQDFVFTKQLSITKKESSEIEQIQKKNDIFEDINEINHDIIISDIEYSQDV